MFITIPLAIKKLTVMVMNRFNYNFLKKTKNVEKKIGISEKTITSDIQWQFYCFSEGFT
jgi:hypothetical protein